METNRSTATSGHADGDAIAGAMPRIDAVDLARGLALVAMTTFHFGWDLEMFGFVERGFASQPAMIWYARVIASSFLFLVGVSFALAHHDGLRMRPFVKRLAIIAGAALLITIATRIATPNIFIFFGILHHIALASLFAVVLVRLPAVVLVALAVFVLAAPHYLKSPILDAPAWWWTGLNQFVPRSSDYVPVFPFLAAVLAGLAAGRWMIASGAAGSLAAWRPDGAVAGVLRFMGRHSLAYYLVHQPVMIAFLYGVQLLVR